MGSPSSSGIAPRGLVDQPSAIARFEPSSIARFEPSSIARFEPSSIARFEPSSIARFEPNSLASFPRISVNGGAGLVRTFIGPCEAEDNDGNDDTTAGADIHHRGGASSNYSSSSAGGAITEYYSHHRILAARYRYRHLGAVAVAVDGDGRRNLLDDDGDGRRNLLGDDGDGRRNLLGGGDGDVAPYRTPTYSFQYIVPAGAARRGDNSNIAGGAGRGCIYYPGPGTPAPGAGKYVRYSAEQVRALELLYDECPKPSSARRQQLVHDNPVLHNVEPKQIKVWFQNRRCREKQRRESFRLQAVNSKLNAMNKLLLEENDRLRRQLAQLLRENAYAKQQLQLQQSAASAAATNYSSMSLMIASPPPPPPTNSLVF